MPLYEMSCRACGKEDTYAQTIEGRANTPPCRQCESVFTEKVILSAPAVRPDIHAWDTENNGKGRYIDQLQRTIGKKDPNAYCTSQQDAINKATAMGHKVEKTR